MGVLYYFTLLLLIRPIASQKSCNSDNCCDQHEFCNFWARTNECETNKDWMLPNCRISCNTCPATGSKGSSDCRDKHENCNFWSSINECDKNRAWMLPNCPVACNTCSGSRSVPAPAPTPAPAPRPAPAPAPVVANPAPVAANPSPSSGRQVCPREDVSFRRTLSASEIFSSNSQFGCAPQQDFTDCSRNGCYNQNFRTMDGSCNNPSSPFFGAAATPMIRLKGAAFDDGSTAPAGSLRGGRSSPREISRFLLSSNQLFTDNRFNSMVMQWGQFVVHDIVKTSLLPTDRCGGCPAVSAFCFPIHVEPSDQRFGCSQPPCCLSFSRSAPVCGSSPKSVLNENTAFLDGSHIYGSSMTDINRLRDGSSGFLRTSFFNSQVFPPFDTSKCSGPGNCAANFDGGDNRLTLFISLVALQTVFVREHNRLAQQLQQRNPAWTGDRVFQEARRIVGAEIQAITVKEWLPKLVGSGLSGYAGYDQSVNPSIAAEFAIGAMRLGHGMVQETLNRVSPNGATFSANFADDVLKPNKILFEGGVDVFLKGLMSMPIKRPQRITTSITERMFGNSDLAATNLQRGREAGIASYNEMREFCRLRKAGTFDDLSGEITDAAVRSNLKQGFTSPDNIDLYAGCILEEPVGSGIVGPTAGCIISDQFRRLRDGDRFWFQNTGVFSSAQVAELEKVTLSRVICDNADNMQFIAQDAFQFTSSLVGCNTLPGIDLSKWSD